MTRLPRVLRCLALAAAISLSVPVLAQQAAPAPAAPAPETPAPAPGTLAPGTLAPAAPAPEAGAPAAPGAPAEAAPAAPAPAESAAAPAAAKPADPDQELKDAVENYWHFGKVVRYDLAAAAAQQILKFKDQPLKVLEAFEQTAQRHEDAGKIDYWLLKWQGTDQLREPTNQIMQVINAGHRARRSDPKFIEANINELGKSGRGYALAIGRLRDSGELAVPIMLDYLRDPSKATLHAPIRAALRDIGRPALNPLCAATEAKGIDVLIPVAAAIGDLGYPSGVPYLARLADGQSVPAPARATAAQALSRMGVDNPGSISTTDAFYDLGERFYYDNADITADKRDPGQPANIWYWDEQKGLVRKEVPQGIFNEIMSMRACEYALKLGQSRGNALALWLAANYKREAELPQGATDPTRAENQPDAHYYGVSAGTSYLNEALARALRDRESRVALPVIKSLQDIVGNSNMFAGPGSTPALIDAMGSADRLVRFEAAFAIAAALPQRPFPGQERVVPLLGEAMSQTGQPSALVVVPQQDRLNAIVDGLKKENYSAIGATSPDAAVAAAAQLPAVDVILVSEELGAPQVDRLLALAAQNGKLAGAARVIITRTAASPYAARTANEPLLSITQATDAAGLKAAADAARAKASSIPIDQTAAANYALRAAELMGRLAISSGQVLDLSAAAPTVVAALRDARPDVVKAAGHVIGWVNINGAQGAVLQTAENEKTADDVKISLYKSLAQAAKNFGNQLSADEVKGLEKVVASATNLEVRSAAAEARGAANLPAEQAKTLIVQQSRV
jgi:hypothetical protein